MDKQEKWLDVMAISKVLGVSRKTIYDWLGDPRIDFPHIELPNGRKRFILSEVREWMGSGRRKSKNNIQGAYDGKEEKQKSRWN